MGFVSFIVLVVDGDLMLESAEHHPAYDELVSISGEENVRDGKLDLLVYSRDASPFQFDSPGVVVRPGCTEEVAEIMRVANGKKIPVVAVGARSSINGAPLPRVSGAIMLDLTRMDYLREVDEDTMTVTVGAGLRWAELIHLLKEKGFKLGFRGPYGGNAGTVGGSLSGNSIGCGASRWGGACDSVVGLEVVLPTGEIIRTGSGWNPGSKVFARYSTFNDLTGLFLGDHGTLGVKTEVTLKVYYTPSGVAFADYGFESIEDCAKVMHELQRRKLAEELVLLGDKNSIELLANSYLDFWSGLECILAVIIEEEDEELANRKKEIVDRIAKRDGRSLGTFLSKAHWTDMFNMVQPLFDSGFWYNTCHLRPISTLPETVKGALKIFEKYDVKGRGMNWIISALGVDRSYCTGWITLFMGPSENRELMEKVWGELKQLELSTGGAVPYWCGPLWERECLSRVSPAFHNLLRKIKGVLDPNNILHPTVFGL